MLTKWRLCLLLAALLMVAGSWWGISAWRKARAQQQFQRGLIALQQGDLDQVAAQSQFLRTHPDFQHHVHLLQGAHLLYRDQLEAALQEFSRSRPAGELRVPGLLLAGECLYRLGRLEEAEALFIQLLQEQPDNAAGVRWLSVIQYDQGNLGEALTRLRQLAVLMPLDYAPLRLMGKIYQEDCRQYSKAVDCYRQALQRRPPAAQRPTVLFALAGALSAQGEYTESLAVLAQLPPAGPVLALQAHCHWHLGHAQQARTLLERARTLDPHERSALMLEARMREDELGPQAAIDSLRKVLARDPHDFPCRYQLALTYQGMGDQESAEVELQRMQESKKFRDRLAELNIQARRLDDVTVRERIAQLCADHGLGDLAATWRQSAELSRRIGSAGELGPAWFDGGSSTK